MKILALILSFQLCFMVAEPVLAQHFSSNNSVHKCCQRSEKPMKKDCCENNACAYFSCVCCIVCVKEDVQKTELFCRFFRTEKLPLKNENFLADFAKTNFHPPQIV